MEIPSEYSCLNRSWRLFLLKTYSLWRFQRQRLIASSKRYIRSNVPLDDLERRARYPPVDAMGRPLLPKPGKALPPPRHVKAKAETIGATGRLGVSVPNGASKLIMEANGTNGYPDRPINGSVEAEVAVTASVLMTEAPVDDIVLAQVEGTNGHHDG